MKLFLTIALLAVAFPAIAQVQGPTMRATNGFTIGTTTIGGRLLATNTAANGGTNYIYGSLFLGQSNLLRNDAVLHVNKDTTNPTVSVRETLNSLTVSHTSANPNLLHNGISLEMAVGAGNTADWTESSYPQLMGVNASITARPGSSGTIRRAAGVASTVAGAFPLYSGASFDEAVMFWGDTANAGGMNYVVGAKLSGLDHGTNNTGIWLGIPQNTYPQSGNWGIWDETGYPSYFSGNVGVGVIGSTNKFAVVAGSLSTNKKAFSVTGTLANSAGVEIGADMTITSAGAGASGNQNRALNVSLTAGYTGSAQTFGIVSANTALGTGTNAWTGSFANYGISSSASGNGSGHKAGVLGSALGSSTVNMGGIFRSVSANNTPNLNVGVVGLGQQGTASAGGFFGLGTGDPVIATTAALMADNSTVAAPIFVARDNGTEVFSISDGGSMNGNASGVSNAVDMIAGNCIVITTNANNRTFTIAVGNSTTNYIFFYTNTTASGSAYSPYSIALTNGIIWQGGGQITNSYTATATLDFASLVSIGCEDLTITCTGAATGDVVSLGVPNASIVANGMFSAWVSSADTVSVRFCTMVSGDPASGVFRVQVNKWK